MTLKYPWLLLLLLVVPLLLYLRYGRRRQPALQFSDTFILHRLSPGWAVLAQPVLPILYALGLSLLVVAMARPQKGLAESRVRAEAVDIVLLVDVSTSMRAEDFSTATRTMDRLDAAKQVIEAFVDTRSSDRLVLVAFSAMPYTVSPLTLDHGWLLQRLQALETGMLEDGTAIGDALASAVNRLRESKAKSKVVVLLTDGINNRGRLSPENAAQAARALAIKVYTIGAGAMGLVPFRVTDPFGHQRVIQQPSEIDEGTLQRIAEITGARYFRATDMRGLKRIYEEIDALEKTEISIDQYTRFEERFLPWAGLALICLCVEKLLSLTRLGRLP